MPPTSAAVLDAIARAWALEPRALVGRCRTERAVAARFAAVLLLRDVTRLNASQTARRLNRDHSTIWSAYQRAGQLLLMDSDFVARLGVARAALGEARRGG